MPGITADQLGNPWFTEALTSRIATLTIPNAPLQAQPATISGVVNQPLVDVPIATFTDPDGPSPSTQYTATINWGDGTPVDSNVTFNPVGTSSSFQLLGNHTYTTAGKFTPVVTITDLASPRTATAFDSATISVSPVGPAGSITATAGTPFLDVDATGASHPVATFPVNPATPGGYSATIDWGDGTALGGATIIPTPIAMTDGITGNHTFAQPGIFNGSITLHNPDGSLTVFPLTSVVNSLNASINPKIGTAGTPLGGGFLTDVVPTPLSLLTADSAYYSATVDWGDGVTTAATFGVGVSGGFSVFATPHTYAAPGTYTLTLTVGDAGAPNLLATTGAVTITGLAGTPTPQSGIVGQPIGSGQPIPLETVSAAQESQIEAAFPAPKAGYYSATIDWGDGSPTSVGTLSQNPDGTFTVNGPSHTYQSPGDFHVNILIGTTGQPNLATFGNTIAVTEAPISISGGLNPTSDTGISDSDGITKDTVPNFLGTAAPDATVRLYAIPASSSSAGGGNIPSPVAPILIGQGAADPSGAYSITSSPLADGTYDIEAIATCKFGTQAETGFIESGSHPLVIDTVGPTITHFAVSNTLKGRFQVTYQDGLSGLVVSELVNGANYGVQRTTPKPEPGQRFIVSSLGATVETTPTTPVTVTGSVFNGHYLVLRGGEFVFTISGSGITDVAGNALDGEFYGTFPTGDGHNGTNFKAEVIIRQYTPSGPIPFTTANPSNPGVPAVSPTALAPKLKKPGLNAPPTSLPGVNTGEEVSSISTTSSSITRRRDQGQGRRQGRQGPRRASSPRPSRSWSRPSRSRSSTSQALD